MEEYIIPDKDSIIKLEFFRVFHKLLGEDNILKHHKYDPGTFQISALGVKCIMIEVGLKI